MGTTEDFSNLFSGMENDLKNLDNRFPLKNFNFMVTSQRSMNMIHNKLKKVVAGQVPSNAHQNFWADLRILGLAKPHSKKLSKFGLAVYDCFNQENNDFKREHFILKNIRNKSYDIPSAVHREYLEKVTNLKQFLKIIPSLNTPARSILYNLNKLYFTECLNTFPLVLKRYFQLSEARQKDLDNLHESGLKQLFDSSEQNTKHLYKVANRFWNVCRAFERRSNFIKSVILSEYEEKSEKTSSVSLSLKKLPTFKKILNDKILQEIVSNSTDIQIIKSSTAKKYAVSINRQIDEISKVKSEKQISKKVKQYTKPQLDSLLSRYSSVVEGKITRKVKALVSRVKRNQTIANLLKAKYEYKCQICGLQIPKKNGGFYIENAHIEALGKKGKDLPDNMIIVCPNHHKMIDYGDFSVISITNEKFTFKLNGQRLVVIR